MEFVLGFVGRRVADPEVALDLTSEVFAAAYLYRHAYDPTRGPARAWLVGIARNKISEYARGERTAKEARRRLRLQHQPLEDADLVETEALIAAADALLDLPVAQRTAIWYRHVLDHPYEQIAADTDTKPATVRKRVSLGLARLARRAGA